MSMTAELVLVVTVLLVLLAVRVPVAFGLAVSGMVGLALVEGPSNTFEAVGRIPYSATANYTLLIIPLFIALGMVARNGRMATDTFRLASRLLRVLPGGLLMATIAACGGFAAVSGSSVATAVTVGKVSIEEMRMYRYSLSIASGAVAIGGTLGILIPPSIALVLIGIVTGESIGALLIAGIIPGILSMFVYGLAVLFWAKFRPRLVGNFAGEDWPTDPTTASSDAANDSTRNAGVRRRRLGLGTPTASEEDTRTGKTDPPPASYRGAFELALLFVIVIGGIYTGTFTITEAAAVGTLAAVVMLVVDARIDGKDVWSRVRSSAADAIYTTGMIFALFVGASIFTTFIVLSGVTQAFSEWVVGLPLPPLLILITLLLMLIPLGMFLDPISIILIAVPLTYPTVTELGYEGVWFAILFVKLVEIGLVTPPVGMNTFVVASSVPELTVETVFRGVFLFLPFEVLTIALLIAFPPLVTWLPSTMM